MLVSIIMNCYNSEKYLAEAIESVLRQTYNNWELIFWDNNSNDNSAKIFKSYTDQRLKYYHSATNTSLGEARNLAVEKAKGNWLSFLDCDDIWDQNRISLCIEKINQSIEIPGFLYTRAIYFRGDSSFVYSNKIQKDTEKNDFIDILSMGNEFKMLVPSEEFKIFPENIFNSLLEAFFFPWVTVFINKEIYSKVGGINNIYHSVEDYDILLKISLNHKAYFIDEVTAYYRLHQHNLSVEKTENNLKEAIHLLGTYKPNKHAQKGIFNNKLALTRYFFKNHVFRFLLFSICNPFVSIRFFISILKNGFKSIIK